MDKRCDTCRHWDRDDKQRLFPPPGMRDVRTCLRAPMFWDATDWRDDERVTKPEFKDHLMFVQDGSDYKAMLVTRPQFSCIEWSADMPVEGRS